MTVVSRDEWHTIEVGVPLDLKDEDSGEEWSEPQVLVKHGVECIREVISHGEVEGEKVLEILFGCNLAVDGEFYGLDDFIGGECLDLTCGVWRVQAYCTRDYWGEYDTEYNVERLHGPVDEREFEEADG